jgi:hypothetical protein
MTIIHSSRAEHGNNVKLAFIFFLSVTSQYAWANFLGPAQYEALRLAGIIWAAIFAFALIETGLGISTRAFENEVVYKWHCRFWLFTLTVLLLCLVGWPEGFIFIHFPLFSVTFFPANYQYRTKEKIIWTWLVLLWSLILPFAFIAGLIWLIN